MLKKTLVLLVIGYWLLVSFSNAQETLTITTYYPSPYGVYNELRAGVYKDLDDPDNYFIDLSNWSWVYKLNVGPDMKSVPKAGPPTYDKGLLQVGGGCEYNTSIYGGADQANVRAIFGYNKATTGAESFGVIGQTNSTSNDVAGVFGQALGASGMTYGVKGVNKSTSNDASAIFGYQEGSSGVTYGVKGWIQSTTNDASGVYGIANMSSGATNGVKGVTNSTSNFAAGVYGVAAASSGATYGVKGVNNSNANYSVGVYGYSGGTSGETYGVYGAVASGTGYSGFFSGGKGIRVAGKVYATDTSGTGGIYPGDLAEDIRADGCEVGDVVVVDPDNDRSVVKSNNPYSSSLAGVISENPVFYIGQKKGEKPLALAGQVKCKATAENGPIKRGDILVTSSKPGYAMKADLDKIRPGMIVGKALEELKEGEGKILILVSSY